MASQLISVIVAVRNAQNLLADTLRSVINQTSNNYEIIIIDGCSTDKTLFIAEKFSGKTTVLISEPDDGIADAWNKGMRFAKGNWFIFLNAGDLLHRDHFLHATRAMEGITSQPVILYCDVLKFNEKNELTFKISGNPPSHEKIRRGSLGFAHPGSLASAECFKQIGGFNTALRIAIDTDWLLRCFKGGVLFKKFRSNAYMAEGGVSDTKFDSAIQEYFNCAVRVSLISNQRAKVLSLLLPVLRRLLHVYRFFVKKWIRALKHLIISIANTFGQLLPVYWLRSLYFRVLGFNLQKGATLGLGFEFYQFGHISIGNNSVVNRDCLFDNRADIIIGDNVSISRNVRIFTAGHDIHSPFFEMIAAPVVIEDHVVIFAGVTILPGVKISRGAVIYPGAVVVKDVAPMDIVGGVPARTLGKRSSPLNYVLNYTYPLAM